MIGLLVVAGDVYFSNSALAVSPHWLSVGFTSSADSLPLFISPQSVGRG